MTEKWFEVTVASSGYIEEKSFGDHNGFGWWASNLEAAPEYQRNLRRTIFHDGKNLYASAEVLGNILDTQSLYGAHYKFGRRKMWQVTEKMLDRAIKNNEYGRRSDREREVQARNDSLIEWLMELAL